MTMANTVASVGATISSLDITSAAANKAFEYVTSEKKSERDENGRKMQARFCWILPWTRSLRTYSVRRSRLLVSILPFANCPFLLKHFISTNVRLVLQRVRSMSSL